MARSEIKTFPHFCGYPQAVLWERVLRFCSGFYGLFLALVSYDPISGTYGLFLNLVPYGFFFLRPGPQNGDKRGPKMGIDGVHIVLLN